ncbi:hypothetical protein [Amycolatopsis sp. cmx-4-54]|uniref:hypothetical protein n=1 Tax=Amycolatopsis sp. cmx-4-54 TaxID=2790936 RepID=UPI00397D379D
MLYIVLVLVLAALGLLVAALITANSLWAWISIGVSVVAGLLLLFDLLRRRKKRAPAEEESDDSAEDIAEDNSDDDSDDADSDDAESAEGEEKKPEDAEQTVLMPAAGELGEEEDTEVSSEPEPTGDPGEEKSAPEDVAIVSELEIEVVVVDEYPRYHVTSCKWLETRDTIPLGIGEARQLGFTPCALCTPDAEIAEQHREKA